MKTFTIDPENNVTVFASSAEAQRALPEAQRFSSVEDLAAIAAEWPGSRLIEVWNGIPGVTPVKKFTDRKVAVRRLWQVLQQLEVVAAREPKPKRTRPTKSANAALKHASTESTGSKKDIVLGLLRRGNGATLDEIMTATGWQAHSVRGFISGTLVKKLNLQVTSEKREGKRVYSVAG